MRVLGIELSGSDAIIALLEQEMGMFYLPEVRARKVTCKNPDRNGDLAYFQKSIAKLAEDYKVDQIVIRERMKKGKFAGGADGFKLEAAIQLLANVDKEADGLEVILMNPATQSAILKKMPVSIPFAETGMKKFQQQAFEVAYAQLSDPKGKVEEARQKEIQKRKQNRDERREAEAFDEDSDY